MPTRPLSEAPLTAGERLAQVEALVQELVKTVEQQGYQLAVYQSALESVYMLFGILPALLNQDMPAVRAAEVRKFRNHLDFETQQTIRKLEKLEPQES
jgi:hypothetical protein